MDQEYIDERRAQAREHRGVWYDVRADKFVAEVYSKGERHFLGHFASAKEAGDAYAAARAELPTGRSGEGTFAQAFQEFLDNAKRDQQGSPLRDEVMTYKEQEFYFEGVEFRSMNKRKRPFYVWSSTCCECGGPYSTMTATSPAGAKGITRRCEAHRVGYRPAAEGSTPKAAQTGDAPQEWIDAANEVLDALSLVSDSFEIKTFLDECLAINPKLPRSFNRFVLSDPKSPVVTRDEKLFPRNT